MARSVRRVAMVAGVAAAMVAASCSSDPAPLTVPDTPDTPETSESSVPSTEPVPTDPSPTDPVVTDPPVTDPPVTDPPVTDPPVTDPGVLSTPEETWSALMVAAGRRPSDPSQDAVIAGLATDEVSEELDELFLRNLGRRVDPFPVAEPDGGSDGGFVVDDCSVISPPMTSSDQAGAWFSGHVSPTEDGGWIVDSITIESLGGCVPAQLAAEILPAYEAYWDAAAQFYDPPDPASELIVATSVGEHLDFVVELAERFVNEGLVLRGRPTTDPRFGILKSTSEVVIADCQVADPDRGVYNIASGERTDLIPPIGPGQTDLVDTTLTFVEGVWKVALIAASRDNGCDPASVRDLLPVVPGDAEGAT